MDFNHKSQNKKQRIALKKSFKDENIFYRILAALFLISLTLMSYEIAICRILSVILSYHYVFFVISLACLGMAAGNIFAYLNSFQFTAIKLPKILIGFSISLIISSILITLLSYFENFATNLLFITLLLIIPFFLFGTFVASVFMGYKERSMFLYAWDLIGASAGCLIIIIILDSIDPVNACALLSLVALIPSLILGSILSIKKRLKKIILIISFIIISFFSVNFFVKGIIEVQIGTNKKKQSFVVLNKRRKIGEIIETKWNLFGKTDLVRLVNFPDIMILYLDGTAGTPMVRFNGDAKNPNALVEGLKLTTPGYFPLFFLKENQKDNALVIGPGGGRDLLLLLMAGYKEIKAIELNKAILDIGKKYSEFNGGIYSKFKNIKIIIGEGRNFVKKNKEKFDLILIQFPYTESSRSVDNYILNESYLFTKEAINDLYNNLTPEGQLVIACNTLLEVTKLLMTFLSLADSLSLTQKKAMERIIILGSKEEKNLIVIKKQEVDFKLASEMEIRAKELGYEIGLCYFPNVKGELNREFVDLAEEKITIQQLISSYKNKKIDIRPVKDLNPFFFKFETKAPRIIRKVTITSSVLGILLAFFYIFGDKLFKKKIFSNIEAMSWTMKKKVGAFLYFSFLGIGFMLIEISLIQKNIILFENPALSMAILLCFILVGAGTGSFFGRKLKEANIRKAISIFLIIIAVITIAYSLLGKFIVDVLLGQTFFIRILILSISSFCLAFFMGIPFPTGLKFFVPNINKKDVAFMWATNGINSVLGSSLALWIAVSWGFNMAMIGGAVCYFINIILVLLFFS